MFKKTGILLIMLNTMSLCAITGMSLHLEHQGKQLFNESFIAIEDNKVVVLDCDDLIVELKQETSNNEGTLTITMQIKNTDGELTLLAHPTLRLRRGSEGKLTMENHYIDHDSKSMSGSVLSVLASFQ